MLTLEQRPKTSIDAVCGFSTLDNAEDGLTKFDLLSCSFQKYRLLASLCEVPMQYTEVNLSI